jgi:hypothetical protein
VPHRRSRASRAARRRQYGQPVRSLSLWWSRSKAFPEIQAAARAQLPADTGLDGELVVWEADRLAFERL